MDGSTAMGRKPTATVYGPVVSTKLRNDNILSDDVGLAKCVDLARGIRQPVLENRITVFT